MPSAPQWEAYALAYLILLAAWYLCRRVFSRPHAPEDLELWDLIYRVNGKTFIHQITASSYDDAVDRSGDFLEDVRKKHPERTVLYGGLFRSKLGREQPHASVRSS